jgi:hypothetical protein
MRGYRNRTLESVNTKSFLYNWMLRILLEKVSDYCYRHMISTRMEPCKLRLELSRRGGVSLPGITKYLETLERQTSEDSLYINTDRISWPVMDLSEVHVFDHKHRAGLQLVDSVASAFYRAFGDYTGKLATLSLPKFSSREWRAASTAIASATV